MIKKPPARPPVYACTVCHKILAAWTDARFGPPLEYRQWCIRCESCWEKEVGVGVPMQLDHGKKIDHITLQNTLAESLHPYVERFDAARKEAGVDARQEAWNAHLRRSALPPRKPFDDPGEEKGYSYDFYLAHRYPGKYKKGTSVE